MNSTITHIQKNNTTSSIGTLLKSNREKLGLSQKEVADRLCLKVSMIQNIEADQAPTDLAPTFLRGYIRSYAKLVHISEEELSLMINQEIPKKISISSPIKSVSIRKRCKKIENWVIRITWLIFFMLISLTGLWWLGDFQSKKQVYKENKSIDDQFMNKVKKSNKKSKEA